MAEKFSVACNEGIFDYSIGASGIIGIGIKIDNELKTSELGDAPVQFEYGEELLGNNLRRSFSKDSLDGVFAEPGNLGHLLVAEGVIGKQPQEKREEIMMTFEKSLHPQENWKKVKGFAESRELQKEEMTESYQKSPRPHENCTNMEEKAQIMISSPKIPRKSASEGIKRPQDDWKTNNSSVSSMVEKSSGHLAEESEFLLAGRSVSQNPPKSEGSLEDNNSFLSQVSDVSLLTRIENFAKMEKSFSEEKNSRIAAISSKQGHEDFSLRKLNNSKTTYRRKSSSSGRSSTPTRRDLSPQESSFSENSLDLSRRKLNKTERSKSHSSRKSSRERSSRNIQRKKNSSKSSDSKICQHSCSRSPQELPPSRQSISASIPSSYSSSWSHAEKGCHSRTFHEYSTSFESSPQESDFSNRHISKNTPRTRSRPPRTHQVGHQLALPTDSRPKMSAQRTPRRGEPPRSNREPSSSRGAPSSRGHPKADRGGLGVRRKTNFGRSDDEDYDGSFQEGTRGNDTDDTEVDSDDGGNEFQRAVVNIIDAFRYMFGLTLAQPVLDTFNYASILGLRWDSDQKSEPQREAIGPGARRYLANAREIVQKAAPTRTPRTPRHKLGPITEESSVDDYGTDGGKSRTEESQNETEHDVGKKIGCFGKFKNKFKKNRKDDDSDEPYMKEQTDDGSNDENVYREGYR